MTPVEAQSRQQVRLWSAACGISAFLNLAGILGIVALSPALPGYGEPGLPHPAALAESVATIIPEVAAAREPTTPEAAKEKTFTRTSFDQESAPPDVPSFIGERNTRATSDAPPLAAADPRMPGQAGEEPGHEGQMETTESDYQEGDLASTALTPPDMSAPPAQESMKAREGAPGSLAPEQSQAAGGTLGSNSSVPKERIATSLDQVERPARMMPPEAPEPATSGQVDSSRGATPLDSEAAREGVGPAAQATPGFTGSQRKTHIQGSITRHGRSALDVEDSLLGRYHAALSLAVEKEWNLNCVRNEKYLTEGKIIVEFSVEPSGKVRSLTFVEEFGVGNIQKGFTSESIRSAKIPPFPSELKKQLDGAPLEVTYSFTF